MTRNLVISASFLLCSALPLSAGRINFVYPTEGALLPAVQKTFVFGNVSPSTATLTINGQKTEVYKDGGFISYLPVQGGTFTFRAELGDGATAQRSIRVAQEEPVPAPSTGTLSLRFTSNFSDEALSPGDYLKVTAAGTPGRKVLFSLEGVFEDREMEEVPPGSGKYYGSYLASKAGDGELTARFKTGLFGKNAEARAKGKVRIMARPELIETSTDTVALKDAPDGGYMMFLPEGVKLVSDGASGGYRRVYLAPGQSAWVENSKVGPAGGLPFPFGYGSETGSIKLEKTAFGTSVSVGLYSKLPYSAEVTPWGLRLTLYYAHLHTNYVMYDSSDTFVKNVTFRQISADRAEIDFETAPDTLWGYDVSYPQGSTSLQVDLRSRPKPSLAWPKPLSGLTVVLDPGHSVYYKCGEKRVPMKDYPFSAMPAGCSLDGAVGPMGTFEVNVNLAIAQRVRDRLEALGAAVKMTRSGDEEVELQDRPKIAKELGGDIFISLHNNAIPDGEDPFYGSRGFTVYYYHRQSLPLAEALHAAYLREIPLPDEGLRYGDYLVARLTWMPAALIESGYMILPEQEELLNSPQFQDKLAGAVADGLLGLFKVPPPPAAKAKKVRK